MWIFSEGVFLENFNSILSASIDGSPIGVPSKAPTSDIGVFANLTFSGLSSEMPSYWIPRAVLCETRQCAFTIPRSTVWESSFEAKVVPTTSVNIMCLLLAVPSISPLMINSRQRLIEAALSVIQVCVLATKRDLNCLSWPRIGRGTVSSDICTAFGGRGCDRNCL